MEKTKKEVMETTFVEEAREEQAMTSQKKDGKAKGFIKKHWKTGALIVLSLAAGYGLGKRSASRGGSDETVPELEAGDDYVEETEI